MTKDTSPLDPAAIATEYARLYALPIPARGPEECRRWEDINDLAGEFGPLDRAAFYVAARQAVDPQGFLERSIALESIPMTPELYAFETWRMRQTYASDQILDAYDGETLGDLTQRLVLVTEPLLWSFDAIGRHTYNTVSVMLAMREIDVDDFPGFSLRRHLEAAGVDVVAAWDASCAAWMKAEAAITSRNAGANDR